IGGVISIVLRSLMLVNTPGLPMPISWKGIVPGVGGAPRVFVFALSAGLPGPPRAAPPRPAGGGLEGGGGGEAGGPPGPGGGAGGEDGRIGEGEHVRIVGVDGLTLRVRRA